MSSDAAAMAFVAFVILVFMAWCEDCYPHNVDRLMNCTCQQERAE